MQRRTGFWQQFIGRPRNIRKRHLGTAAALSVVICVLYYLGDGIRIGGGEQLQRVFFGQPYHELVLLMFSAVIIYVTFTLRIVYALLFTFVGLLVIMPHMVLFPAYPDPVYRILSWLTINVLLALTIGGILNSRERQKIYLRDITNTQEQERQRLSRELHDDTAQELIDVGHKIDDIIHAVDDTQGETISDLHSLRYSIDDILEKTRRAIQGLQPPLLDEVGIKPALLWLCDSLAEETGIEVESDIDLDEDRLTQEIKLVIFRVIQESLTNIKKHSHATKAGVILHMGESRLTIEINDNGEGFVPRGRGKMMTEGKLGLVGVQERLGLINGTFNIRSRPGEGTTIRIEIPIPEEV
jgi:signal transduction histidine kinase